MIQYFAIKHENREIQIKLINTYKMEINTNKIIHKICSQPEQH